MGGFFGAVSHEDTLLDVFFGTDYHSHLGTRSAGIAAFDPEQGLLRKIHNIENTPFRTKFERIREELHGVAAMGTINDTDPQPLLVQNALGRYAIAFVGIITNAEALIRTHLSGTGGQLMAKSGGGVNTTELLSALISKKEDLTAGIRFAQEQIEGSATVLLLTDRGTLIAARDRMGRLPVHIGRKKGAHCVSFEPFAYQKLGYEDAHELSPGEIVELTADSYRVLREGNSEMRLCSFLFSYYGFPASVYEGVNVEEMRCKNGEIMAENDRKTGKLPAVDCVAGVPDSGTPHAIGYANRSHLPFKRPFIKYTATWPRSFMPSNQGDRNRIAKMKQIPVCEQIKGRDLLFVDDSVVRGTQLRETVDFLYESGAQSVHVRSACPPIMYGCKYLNFSRATSDNELITRATILELEGEEGMNHLEEYSDKETPRGRRLREAIAGKLHLASLEFQSLPGLQEAIGLSPCKLCTYCWNGKE